MDDIEALCNRVMVIGNGQILSDGPLEELRNRFGQERLLKVDFVEENVHITEPKATVVKQDGHRTILRFNPDEIAASELISKVAALHPVRPVRDLTVENPPIGRDHCPHLPGEQPVSGYKGYRALVSARFRALHCSIDPLRSPD
jgi:ABC-2 type transport system ATP-binding protein